MKLRRGTLACVKCERLKRPIFLSHSIIVNRLVESLPLNLRSFFDIPLIEKAKKLPQYSFIPQALSLKIWTHKNHGRWTESRCRGGFLSLQQKSPQMGYRQCYPQGGLPSSHHRSSRRRLRRRRDAALANHRISYDFSSDHRRYIPHLHALQISRRWFRFRFDFSVSWWWSTALFVIFDVCVFSVL